MSKNPLQNLFSDIANAIRNKTGEINSMKPDEFVEKINSISTGGGGSANLSPLEVTENGIYKPTKPVDGFSEVDVKVPIPEGYIKPEGEIEIVENGSVNVAQYENAIINVPIPDGYIKPEGEVEITENGAIDVTQYASAVVNVPSSGAGGEADLRTIEVTENGVYKASENKINSKTTINFNQDYSGFVDCGGWMMGLRIEYDLPAIDTTTLDLTPFKSGWKYTLTSDEASFEFNAEEMPTTINGLNIDLIRDIDVIILVAGNIPLGVLAPSNYEEMLVAIGRSQDDIDWCLNAFPPNTITLVDFASINVLEAYDVSFEYGTVVSDPCDGYSEVIVNVSDSKLKVLDVTKNGTYKASENKSSSKTSVTFNQDYAGFIDLNGMPCIKIPNVVPEIKVSISDSGFDIDDSAIRKNWVYSLREPSSGQSMVFKAEDLPIDISGGSGQAFVELTSESDLPGVYMLMCEAARLQLAVFIASNLVEIFTELGASQDILDMVVSMFEPGSVYLIDLAAMGMTPYEVTFEIGTDVPDPCDGYSEVNVDVKPNLTSLSVTENGTYTIEKTYADSFTYNANTEHNVPEGSIGAFKLDVQLPELDLDTLDINTGNIDLSNFAKDWAFSLTMGDDIISFSAEELPITLDNGNVIKLANREFPELRIASHSVAMFCPSNAGEYIRKLLELMGEEIPEEQIQAMLSMFTPNTVFLFDLSGLYSDYEATFSYNPLPTKYDGYSSVKVEVPAPAPTPTQEKTLTVKENGTSTVVPDDGYNISKVTVTTNVPIPDGYLKPSGTAYYYENGTFDITNYKNVKINVPVPDGYIKPSGSLIISDNGTHNVNKYAEASVNVFIPKVKLYEDGIKMDRITIDKDFENIGEYISQLNLRAPTCLEYLGTMAEWEALEKADNWDNGLIDEIICTDGLIQIHGTTFTYEFYPDIGTYKVTDCRSTTETDIIIPETYNGKPVTHLNRACMDGTGYSDISSVESLTIPDNVEELAYNALWTVPAKRLYMGRGVKKCDTGAFGQWYNLEEVHIKDLIQWYNIEFKSASGNPLYRPPNNSLYKTDRTLYLNNEPIIDLVIPKEITDYNSLAFYGCTTIQSITIPDTTVSLREGAFRYCTSLKTVTIGNGITDIKRYTFRSCLALENVYIGSGVTNIYQQIFDGCSNLTNITYNGTKEQWNLITKTSNWDYNTGEYTIHCTDGDIAKADA